MSVIRVLIADDQTLIRQGLRQICESLAGFEVIAEAENGEECVELVRRLQPDVVLLDIHMPVLDGLEAAHQIRKLSPTTRILMLTVDRQQQLIVDAIRTGARGYLLKTADWTELVTAVQSVLRGELYIDPALLPQIFDVLRSPPARAKRLTDREKEVLVLAAQGFENTEIAEKLRLSVKTVSNIFSDIYRKLGVHNRTQAVLYALRHGWARLSWE